MGTKAKLSTKVLSFFLSVLMAASCFGIALPNLAPAAEAAASEAEWQTLRDALDAALNGGYLGTEDYAVSVDANGNASVNDTTKNGYLYAVVRAVGAVAATEGTDPDAGHDHNAALAAYIIDRMEANEYQAAFITAILPNAGSYAQYDGASASGTWNGTVADFNNLPTYTFTTTVTRDVKGAVLTDYETAYDVPAQVDETYKVTFTGTPTAIASINGQETGAVYKNTAVASEVTTAAAPDLSAIKNYLNFVNKTEFAEGDPEYIKFAPDFAAWQADPDSVYAGDPDVLEARCNAFTALHNAANALDTDYVEKFIGHALMNEQLTYINAALAASKTIVLKPYVDWIHGVETADVAALAGYIHRDNYQPTDRARLVYLRSLAQTYLGNINAAGDAIKALLKEQYGYQDTFVKTADTAVMPNKQYYRQVLVNVGTEEEPVAKATYEPVGATAATLADLYERVDYETYIVDLNNLIQRYDLADIRAAAQYYLSHTVADDPYAFPVGSQFGHYEAASGTAEKGKTYYEKDAFGFYAPKAVDEGAGVSGLFTWSYPEYYGMGAKTYYSEDYVTAGNECPVDNIELGATFGWFDSAVSYLNGCAEANRRAVITEDEENAIRQMKTDLQTEITYRAFDDNSAAFRDEYAYFVNLKLNTDVLMTSTKVLTGYTDPDTNEAVAGLITTAETHWSNLNTAFGNITGNASARPRYQAFVNEARAYVNSMYAALLDRCYAAYQNLYNNVGQNASGSGINASNFTLVKGIIASLDDDRDTPYTESVENTLRNWINANSATVISKVGGDASSRISYINNVHSYIPTYITKCNAQMTGHWTAFGNRYHNDHVKYNGQTLDQYNGSTSGTASTNANWNDTGIYTVRDGMASDMVRADNDKDYIVTRSRIESVITKLDNFAKSTDFVKMIGVYDTYDSQHQVTNLASFIKSILEENLFTDDMVNTFVAMLFPMLADMVENKIISMIAENLPGATTMNPQGSFYLNLQTMAQTMIRNGQMNSKYEFSDSAGNSTFSAWYKGYLETDTLQGNVYVYMNGTHSNVKSFKTVFDELGIKIWPSTLATYLGNTSNSAKYGTLRTKLGQLSDNWMNLDLDHDGEITKDDFVLAGISYGVKDYATFISVMSDFLGAAGALINTLFTNHNFDSGVRSGLVHVDITNAKIHAGGSAGLTIFGGSFGPSINKDVSLGSASADGSARIQIDGMLGYNDLWAPIMEGLGITGYTGNVNVGTTVNSTPLSTSLGKSGNSGTNAVVNGLFLPLMYLIDKVANKPIDTVLGMLPNLAYNIAYENVTGLLDCLKTTLHVDATVNNLNFSSVKIVDVVNINYGFGTWSPDMDVTWLVDQFMGKITDAINGMLEFDPDFDIGGLIDLEKILPFDITNLNDAIGFLLNKIGDGGDSITLPAINTAHLGRLGDLGTRSTVRSNGNVYSKSDSSELLYTRGPAYYVTADKADVLYELIDVVMSFLKQKGSLSGLLSGLGSGGLGSEIENILSGVDAKKSLAALVELFEPQTYKMAAYNWYQPNSASSTFTFGNSSLYPNTMAQGGFVYLQYANNWSREQATYMYENLEDAVDDIFEMIDSDMLEGYTGFSDWLLGKVNEIFRNKYVNGFLDTLVDLAAGMDSESKTLPNILKEQLKVGNGAATVDIFSWYYRFGYLYPELRILGTHEVADPTSPTGVKTVNEVLYLDKNGNICVGYPEEKQVKLNPTDTNPTTVTEMHFVRTYPLAPSGFAGFRTDALTDEKVPAASGSNLPGRVNQANITFVYSPKYNTSHTKRYENYAACNVSADGQYNNSSITIGSHTFGNRNMVTDPSTGKTLFNGVTPVILTEAQHEDSKDGNYITWEFTGNANTGEWGIPSGETRGLVDGSLGGNGLPSARAVFFSLIASFFEPLAPAFSFILNGKDLTLFNSALTVKGYDVYNGAVVPLMEALGISVYNSTQYNSTYGNDATGGFYYLANKVFSKLNDILTKDANGTPTQKLINMLPGIYYYLQSDGLGTLLKNVVMPIWVLVDDVRPLVNLKLDVIVKGVAGKLFGVNALTTEEANDPIYKLLSGNLDIEQLLKKDPDDPARLISAIQKISLKKLTLKDLAELAGAFTGMELLPLFYAFEGMCYGYTLGGTKYGAVKMANSSHYDIATFNSNGSKVYTNNYTLKYLGPDVITVTISAVLDLLRFKWTKDGVEHSNAQALDDLIGLARELLPGETLSASLTATGLLDGLEKVFARRESDTYIAPNWDYILEGKAVKSFEDGNTILWDENITFTRNGKTYKGWEVLLLYNNLSTLDLHNKHDEVTKRALAYKTDWTRQTALSMDQLFANLLDWVTASFLAKDSENITFSEYINGVIDGELLGAKTLKSLVGLIAKLYQYVPGSIIALVDNLLDTNLLEWQEGGYFRKGVATNKILDEKGNPVLDKDGNEMFEDPAKYYVNDDFKWWSTESQIQVDEHGDPVIDPVTGNPIEIQVPVGDDYVDDRDKFFDAITELIEPIASLFGFIFLEDGYKFFYTAGNKLGTSATNGGAVDASDDDDAIILEGLGIWRKGLIPLLEAMGIEKILEAKGDSLNNYKPSKYTTDTQGVYDSEQFVTDFIYLLRTFAEGIVADPVAWLLNNLPNVIYFINANGLSTAVKNIFDSIQDIIDMVNTQVDASDRISTSNLAGIDLSALTLDGLLKLVGQFTAWEDDEGVEHPGIHVRDDLVEYIRNLYFGTLSCYDSANGEKVFRMDALATNPNDPDESIEDRANFITVLIALVLEVLEDEGTFLDTDNGFVTVAYNNAACIDALAKTDGLISQVLSVVKDPNLAVKYKNINWKYFDETVNLADVDDDGKVLNVPAYLFVYLNYTTRWTYDKALATATGLEEMILSVLKYVEEEKFGDIESLGQLITVDKFYNGELLQSLLDMLANVLYGEDAVVPVELLNVAGCLLGADLTQWNRTYAFASAEYFGSIDDAETDDNGLKFKTLPARIARVDAEGKKVKDDQGNVIYDEGDPIKTYLINDRTSFVTGVTMMLEPAYSLLDWLLFNDSYEFFNGNTAATQNDVLITLQGSEGYAKGLVLLLEALGCEGLKYPSYYESADGVDTEAYMSDILTSLCNRIEAICANPVTEISNLIPELIYFINAGGLQVSVANILAGPLALVNELKSIPGLNIEIGENDDADAVVNALVTDALSKALADYLDDGETFTFALDDINLQYVFEIVELITNLEITDCVGDKLDKFYMGEIYRYNSMSGENDKAYKMMFSNEEDFADFITIMLSLVIDVLLWDGEGTDNAQALADLVATEDTEAMTAEEMRALIIEVIDFLKDGFLVEDPRAIDWLYFDPEYSIYDENDELKEEPAEITVDTVVNVPDRFINYITYASDWTDELAHYIYNNRNDLILSVLKMAKATDKEVMGMKLGEIFDGTGAAVGLMDKLYTGENLNKILSGIQSLTEKVPAALFDLLYIVLDIDFSVYTNEDAPGYIAPFAEGVMTRDAFIDGLATIVSPLSTILDWLLFGKAMEYFDKKDYSNGHIDVLLTISGAAGYQYGLVPIMEALGIENIPAFNAVSTTQTMLKPVLKALFGRVEEILANPVDEILEILPNLLYFINARGLITSVENLLMGPMALLDRINAKLDPDGTQPEKRITINRLLTEMDLGFETEVDIFKLDLKGIFTLVEDATGLQIIKLSEADPGFIDAEKIENFYFGKIELSRSANGKVRGTMSYTEEEDAADMLTILVNLAVEFALYSWGEGDDANSNAAILESLIDEMEPGTITGIIDALDTLGTKVVPANYHWNYFNETDKNPVNETVYDEPFYYLAKEKNVFANYLTYSADQSWTQATANALYQNLPSVIDKVLTVIAKDDPEKAKTVSDIIHGAFNLYTGENLDAIVGYIDMAYDYIDELVNLIGLVLGADLTGWQNMTSFADLVDEDGNPVIKDRDSFRAGLVEIIKPLYPVLDWLLFGKDYRFFVSDTDGNLTETGERDDNELIVIPGANGYAYALVPLLTILGVDLPACKVGVTTCGTVDETGRTFLDRVIDAVLTRLDAILDHPVAEALELLPQILYFINANGAATMVENLLGAVINAADVLVQNGTLALEGEYDEEYEVGLKDFVFEKAGVNIENLDLEAIIAILEQQSFLKGLKINEVFTADFDNDGVKENVLEYFYMGAGAERTATSVTNEDGTVYSVYKLRLEDPENAAGLTHPYVGGDVITTLLCIVLEVLMYENEFGQNSEPIAAFVNSFAPDLDFGPDNVILLRALLKNGIDDPEMEGIHWAYWYEGDEEAKNAKIVDMLSLDVNALAELPERTVNYLTYDANNNQYMHNLWSEDAVKFVDENLNDIVDRIINLVTKGETEDLNALIKNNFNVFSDEIANKLVGYVQNALGRLDDLVGGADETDALLAVASQILGMDLTGIRTAKAEGIENAEDPKAAFVDFLVDTFGVLNPVLDWLLFGKDYRFFTELETGAAHTIILKGGEGYKYGLAPILDALGVDTAISAEKADVALREVLTNVADRIEEILDNPIDEVLALLPELIYFINADGLTVCANNLIAPIDALLAEVGKNIGMDDLSLNSLIKAVDLDDLDFDLVYGILADKTGIILNDEDGEPIGKYLKEFYFGELNTVTIYDDLKGFHMVYTERDARYDMVTIIVTLVLDVIVYEGNKDAIINLLKKVDENKAEGIYNAIVALLTHNEKSVDMVPYNWILTEYDKNGDGENAGKIVMPVALGATLNSSIYGPLYTRAMGEYITKNFDLFVDTWITLLGIEGKDGKIYRSLNDLLDGVIGGTIYKKEVVQSIADGVGNAVENLQELLGQDLFNYVVEVLDESLDVDLTKLENYVVESFEEGDRDTFVANISEMLDPVAPILRWLLTDQALSLFTDRYGDDYIVLNGAKGYKDSIIPIMEALHVPADSILTQEEYEAATAEDDAALLSNILNPILDRVDEIIEDPTNEILNVLPAVAYFVNSKGLDSAFKNLLNAVFQLLETIDPVIADVDKLHKDGKVSLYPLMGQYDLEVLDFEGIANILIELVNSKVDEYGFELTGTLDNAIQELTVGIVESFASKRGETDYTMNSAHGSDVEGDAGDVVDLATVVMRIVLNFISKPANVVALEAVLEPRVNEEGYKFISSLLENFQQYASTEDGIDKIMYTVYQIYYAALVSGVATNNGLAEFNGNYSFLNNLFGTSEYAFLRQLEKSFGDLLNKWTGDVVDDDEVVPKGFIKLFKSLADFFQKIIRFFQNLLGI